MRQSKVNLNHRFDQSVCDEAAHTTDLLRVFCGGPSDPNTDSSFRQVLTHQGNVSSGSSDVSPELLDKLTELLLPSALTVFGENNNDKAYKVMKQSKSILKD